MLPLPFFLPPAARRPASFCLLLACLLPLAARAANQPDIIFRDGFEVSVASAATAFPDPSFNGSGATLKLGADGTVHLLYDADDDAGDAPVRYGECSAGCLDTANWHFLTLGSYGAGGSGGGARMALDAAGHPRVVWYAQAGANAAGSLYYGECDGACTVSSNWSIAAIGSYDAGTMAFPPAAGAFALDPQGRPRLVLQDTINGVQYARCNDDCTQPANWLSLPMSSLSADAALAFDADGQPRILFEDLDADVSKGEDLYYAACDADCLSANQWTTTSLSNVDDDIAPLPFALALDSLGAPRMVFRVEGSYVFGGCDATCSDGGQWGGSYTGDAQRASRPGVALALGAGDLPVYAWNDDDSGAGDRSISVSWCSGNCLATTPSWQRVEVESAADITLPAPDPCATGGSYWQLGPEPSLALDAAGMRHLAYDVYFVADCPDGFGGYYLYSGDGPIRYAELQASSGP